MFSFIVILALSNPASVPSNSIDPPSPFSNKQKPPPPPLTSVDALLHGTSDLHINDQPLNDSPIAQVRSSVERQMSQLQQELLHGFPHRQSSRVCVNIVFLFLCYFICLNRNNDPLIYQLI